MVNIESQITEDLYCSVIRKYDTRIVNGQGYALCLQSVTFNNIFVDGGN